MDMQEQEHEDKDEDEDGDEDEDRNLESETIEFFHNKLSTNSLNLMTNKMQSKRFDPIIPLIESQCADHGTKCDRNNVKWTPVYAPLLL